LILKKEAIKIKRYRQIKPDTAKGFVYYNNFKIRKLANNHIIENHIPEVLTSYIGREND